METHRSSLDRLVTFSDAVFAIAITLLALEIRVPEADPEHLPQALSALVPSIAVYALTFIVIGLYWISHHRMFQAIVRFDYALVWLNFFVLMCVAFLPAPNAIFARNASSPYAVVFYTSALAATSLASGLLWLYATRGNRLVREDVSPRTIRSLFIRSVNTIGVAIVAAGLAFISTAAAFGLLVLYALTNVAVSVLTPDRPVK